jgi:c(7)-type cytochrome triheme protein
VSRATAIARSATIVLALLLTSAAQAQAARDQRQWTPLAADGLHDPANPALKLKQPPAEALRPLAPDTTGNQVRWVEALDKGQIKPRAALNEATAVRVREDDILLNLRGGTPIVRFPHRAHTLWLDCSNCHDRLFLPKAGANRLSMQKILQGEQCGVCHGAVAFPLTECSRCHNTPRPRR